MDERDDIVTLWQHQPLAEKELDMKMIIERAERFQQQIGRRNFVEYFAAGVLVLWAVVFAARSEASLVIKAGVALIALGGLGAAAIIRLRGRATDGRPPLASPTREVLRWHRLELARQRDLLRGAPVWYLGPFVPGLTLLLVGAWFRHPDQAARITLSGVLVVLVFAGVAWMNLRGARKLEEQIDAVTREIEG